MQQFEGPASEKKQAWPLSHDRESFQRELRQLGQLLFPNRTEFLDEGVVIGAIRALEAALHKISILECTIRNRKLTRMTKERTETGMELFSQYLCPCFLDDSPSNYYASLFHQADVPFVVVSRTGVFLDMNAEFLHQWGCTPSSRLNFDRLLDSPAFHRVIETLVSYPDRDYGVSVQLSRGTCVVDLSFSVWSVPLATTVPQDVGIDVEPCVCMLQIV